MPPKMLLHKMLQTILFGCLCYFIGTITKKRSNVLGYRSRNFTRNEPFIFIASSPESGKCLMSTMLDNLPDVYCGEDVSLLLRKPFTMYSRIKNSSKETNRLKQAGISQELLREAMASYIIPLIGNAAFDVARVCNMDPSLEHSTVYLAEIFPNAKFIFMVRDGRAVVHSILTRNMSVYGHGPFGSFMQRWNQASREMNSQCNEIGQRCLKVRYEELVIDPKTQMKRVLDFLELPFNDSMVHHEGKPTANCETRSDKLVRLDKVDDWVGHTDDFTQDMNNIAPMLRIFGYDPTAKPPNYSKLGEMKKKELAYHSEEEEEEEEEY